MCLDLNMNTVIKSSKLAFLRNAGFNKKVQFDLSTFTVFSIYYAVYQRGKISVKLVKLNTNKTEQLALWPA